MGLFKKIAKKAYKHAVKPGFLKPKVPSWGNVKRAANKVSPVRGFVKVAKAIKAAGPPVSPVRTRRRRGGRR